MLAQSSFGVRLIFGGIGPKFCGFVLSISMYAKNILYAEDNPDDVVILKLALKRAGLGNVLREVEDGEEAIEWLRGDGKYANREQHPLPDLLVLDLKMPRKSGFDVLEWLRKTSDLQNLSVVILSSSDDPRDIQRAAELGTTKYLKKSARCEELIQLLKSTPV